MTAAMSRCFLFVGILGFATPAIAADKTYTCTAVQDKAALGVSESRAVSISTSGKVCNFSVDGASVSATGKQAFFKGMNELLSGGLDSIGQGSQKEELLRHLLLGPFHGMDVDQRMALKFRNAVNNELGSISSCIHSFTHRSGNSFLSANAREAFCRVHSFSNTSQVVTTGVTISGTGAVLEVGVILNDAIYRVFIPQSLVASGRGGFRFR